MRPLNTSSINFHMRFLCFLFSLPLGNKLPSAQENKEKERPSWSPLEGDKSENYLRRQRSLSNQIVKVTRARPPDRHTQDVLPKTRAMIVTYAVGKLAIGRE